MQWGLLNFWHIKYAEVEKSQVGVVDLWTVHLIHSSTRLIRDIEGAYAELLFGLYIRVSLSISRALGSCTGFMIFALTLLL